MFRRGPSTTCSTTPYPASLSSVAIHSTQSPSRPVVESISTSPRVTATTSVRSSIACFLSNPLFKVGFRVGLFVAVLDDDRSRQAEPPLRSHALRDGARAWHDNRAFGDNERRIAFGLDDAPLWKVVDRRRSRQDRSSSNHRASFDDGAFVNAGVAPHEHIVFDDDRNGAHRLDDAADLRARADMHALADLRARP